MSSFYKSMILDALKDTHIGTIRLFGRNDVIVSALMSRPWEGAYSRGIWSWMQFDSIPLGHPLDPARFAAPTFGLVSLRYREHRLCSLLRAQSPFFFAACFWNYLPRHLVLPFVDSDGSG